MQPVKYLFPAFCLLFIANCAPDETQSVESREWTLTWSDEFDGAAGTAPDPTKWTYDIGRGDNGWGNAELQSYTDNPENVVIDGEGKLVITATRSGNTFASARLKTQGLFSQAYGRFEASIKSPYGPGVWPAFWMLGSNIDEVPWPRCGEIDVMEIRGQQPGQMAGSVHGPGYSGGQAVTTSYGLEDGRFDDGFYLFAVEWDEDKIDFYVDDFLYQRITPDDVDGDWVYDSPFFLLLNIAVGGNYVGFPTDDTPFPQTMEIDYVRVYE